MVNPGKQFTGIIFRQANVSYGGVLEEIAGIPCVRYLRNCRLRLAARLADQYSISASSSGLLLKRTIPRPRSGRLVGPEIYRLPRSASR